MKHSRYSGLINCKKCGKNYKVKKERGTIKYICSGYDKFGKSFCERDIVKEEELDGLIEFHYRNKLEDYEIRNEVDRIEIHHEKKLIIFYKDGTQTIRSKNFFQV